MAITSGTSEDAPYHHLLTRFELHRELINPVNNGTVDGLPIQHIGVVNLPPIRQEIVNLMQRLLDALNAVIQGADSAHLADLLGNLVDALTNVSHNTEGLPEAILDFERQQLEWLLELLPLRPEDLPNFLNRVKELYRYLFG